MVRITKDRVGDRVEVRQADLALPLHFLDSDSFDVVVASLVLHYLEDWTPTLREIHRVLRPKGHLIVSTHHPFMDFTLFQRPNYFLRELLQDQWEKGGQPFDVWFYRRPLTEILNSVLDAGFVIDGFSEPQPLPEVAQRSPEEFKKLSTRPWFLLVRGRQVSESVNSADKVTNH
jgi:SAM-dependent methyltransferase